MWFSIMGCTHSSPSSRQGYQRGMTLLATMQPRPGHRGPMPQVMADCRARGRPGLLLAAAANLCFGQGSKRLLFLKKKKQKDFSRKNMGARVGSELDGQGSLVLSFRKEHAFFLL